MTYIPSIPAQAAVFCKTVGFGFFLGVAYDLLRPLRLLAPRRRLAALDVSFGAFAGAAAFLFGLTQNGGRLRLHLLLAIAAGFCVWRFGAAAPLRFLQDKALRVCRRTAFGIRRRIDGVRVRLRRQGEKCAARLKKAGKKLKKMQKSS